MRPAGFSTGAIAHGDFRGALRALAALGARGPAPEVLELSALRLGELPALCEALAGAEPLPLHGFRYVSLHAPSRYPEDAEAAIAAALSALAPPLPVVLHPDAIHEPARWEALGSRLLIENMDLRKRTGQTAAQLAAFFARLPEAGLCFDLAHAYQVDPTLQEARAILERFGPRLRQLHLSEIDAGGQHHALGARAAAAFQALAPLIPAEVPVIIESQVGGAELAAELARAQAALPTAATAAARRR